MPFQHQNSQIRLSEAADGSSTKSNRIEPGELGGAVDRSAVAGGAKKLHSDAQCTGCRLTSTVGGSMERQRL